MHKADQDCDQRQPQRQPLPIGLDHLHIRIDEPKTSADAERAGHKCAAETDCTTRGLIAGEALDVIRELSTAVEILANTTAGAALLLSKIFRFEF